MRDETMQALQQSLDDFRETIDRLILCNKKYQQTCTAILTELEQRASCDPDTAWMSRHILNLRNALPPTIKPATMRKADGSDVYERVFNLHARQA